MQTHASSQGGKNAHDSQMEHCINNCIECAKVCLAMLSYCLEKGGEHTQQITLLSNCADICGTSAKFMLTGSELHAHTCRACAEVCQACAEDCAVLGDDMEQCAEVCTKCAESCKQMAMQ